MVTDPVSQASPGLLAVSSSANFEGIGQGFMGPGGTWTVNLAPPAADGAIGPAHYFQIVNSAIAVFDKTGTPIFGPVRTNTLWSGFGGPCETRNDGDGSVKYDRFADRWVVSQLTTVAPFFECVAVSMSGDPTGSYARYAFPRANLSDYPKIGVWPDAYYATFNIPNGGLSLGSEICAFDRAKMLAGLPATQQCFTQGASFTSLLASDAEGTTPPPLGAPNYVMGLASGQGALSLFKFHVDWFSPANTTLTEPTFVRIEFVGRACTGGGTCIPQPGTTTRLDSLGDRLMNRLVYRNFGDHEALVVNHSIDVGGSVGIRWYEVRGLGGSPEVFQQGTYAPDSDFRWMGSAAMNGAGSIGLGFSASSTVNRPSIRFTGRLASDPPGIMGQGEGVLITGAGVQTGLSRWGDSSSLTVDPSDDCTFWYTNQYQAVTGSLNWHTRVGSFTLGTCITGPSKILSIAASPTSVFGGASVAGAVALTDVAPAGGATIMLTSGNPGLVGMPASVTVPAGSASTTFPITTALPPVQTDVTLTATFPSDVNAATSLRLRASPIPASLTLNPATVPGTFPSTGTVTLDQPAPVGGAVVTLGTSNAMVAGVPASITIPEGAFSGSFTVTTAMQTGTATAMISALVGGLTQTAALGVTATPMVRMISFFPTQVESGKTVTATLQLWGPAPAGGAVVPLTTNNTAAATVPASVTIPAGQLSANFPITTFPVSVQTTVTISATYPTGVTIQNSQLVLAPGPTPLSMTISPTTVVAGQSTTGTVNLTSPARAGGLTLALTGFHVVLQIGMEVPAPGLVPSVFTIPEGAQSGTFTISTSLQNRGTTVRIKAAIVGLDQLVASATFTVPQSLPVGNAVFDPTLRTPRCSSVGSSCDSGGLIDSKDNMLGGAELNTPNTINGSCIDGNFGIADPFGHIPVYHVDGSIDRLKVSTTDGSPLAGRKAVTIEATVWSFGQLDLYSAPDVTNPVWTLITSLTVPQALGADEHVLSATFTLPVGSLQAIRGNWLPGIGAPPNPCGPAFNFAADHDDLVFAVGAAVNVAPVVDAGPDQSVTLPAVANLSGIVTDDGLPNPPVAVTTTWSVVSGPTTVTFGNVNARNTTATFSTTGTYVLRLTGDDSALSASDEVVVTVSDPVNQPPVVNAGSDQTITLPAVADLIAAVTDDGLPPPPAVFVTAWSVVSGPGTVTFSSASELMTTATFSVAGSYTLRLTANDSLLSASDDLVVTVDPVPNQPPLVNVGPDRTVTLPASVTFAAIVTDDGLPNPPATVTTTWSVVNGPAGVGFTSLTNVNTTAVFFSPGTYTLRLTANDGLLSASDDVVVTVNPVPSQPPVVNVGPDRTVTLPDSVTFAAIVTDDGLPNPPATVTTTWSVVSGPAGVGFTSLTNVNTTAVFFSPGTYTLRLTADDGASSVSDDVIVTVNPAPPVNQPPAVNAGSDQTVTLPAAASLTGTVTDDGLPSPPGGVTTAWTKVSGPGTVTFAAPGAQNTTAAFSAAGSYVLRLTASDGALSASDDIAIMVNAAPVNRAPVVNAGPDQIVTLPAAANLTGTVTDDGLPNPPASVTTTWTRVSGPGTVIFGNASSRNTTASFSTAGIYVLRLTASDSTLVTSDNIAVVVLPAPVNRAPVVNAGPDQTLTLPTAANLAGTVSDDGLPNPPASVTTTWTRVSGPGTVTFGNASARNTTAGFSTAGSYVLRLTASDGALSTSDSIAITVNAAPTLKVQYRVAETAVNDNQIKPRFNIVNTGTAAIPLSQLKIRYWYTIDTQQPQTVFCDFATLGCARLTETFTTVSPARPNADRYLEIGFTSAAGSIAAGGQSGEMALRFNKNNFSNFNESNDYSYSTGPTIPAPTSLVDWSRATLYRNGTRIWGVEP